MKLNEPLMTSLAIIVKNPRASLSTLLRSVSAKCRCRAQRSCCCPSSEDTCLIRKPEHDLAKIGPAQDRQGRTFLLAVHPPFANIEFIRLNKLKSKFSIIRASQRASSVAVCRSLVRNRLAVMFLSILFLVILPKVGLADTYVSGTIAGQTWTVANSPYRVVGNIEVALLTISPGVSVFFESNYVFEVDGFLTAIGTESQPIIFACTTGEGWQGIFFNNCYNGSQLVHCQIGNSLNSGIRCINADPIIQFCSLVNNTGNSGGGVYIDNSTYSGSKIAIHECAFLNNSSANYGGGLYVFSGPSPGSDILVTNCTFAQNTSGNEGGALYVNDQLGANIMVPNCTFTSNTAAYVGGAVAVRTGSNKASFVGCTFNRNIANPSNSGGSRCGGGVAVYGSASFDGCLFSQNKVYSDGVNAPQASAGGLYLSGQGSLRNCTFQGNVCQAQGEAGWWAYAYGGAVAAYGNLFAQNCIFAHNVTAGNSWLRGSGIYLDSGNSTVANCTLAYNSNEGLNLASGTARILNSILFFNASGGTQIVGSPTVSYCDVQNGYSAGTNIIVFNPVFVDTTSFMLVQPGSRCIDAGDPSSAYDDSCFPPSLGTVRSDLGAYSGPGACCWNGPCTALEMRSQPVATTACVGGQGTFGVGATGTQPITYQWFFYGTNSASTPAPVAGATNVTCTINNVQSTNAGWYSVRVSNPLGSLNSVLALLTVTPVCVSANVYMGLNISGGVPGQQYHIFSATGLTEPIAWTTRGTFRQTALGVLWIDTNSPANKPNVFYKVTE